MIVRNPSKLQPLFDVELYLAELKSFVSTSLLFIVAARFISAIPISHSEVDERTGTSINKCPN
jgi:hypothetical protein